MRRVDFVERRELELGELVEVLGEAETVEDAVREIAEREPDVVLLDVHMPGGGGVDVSRWRSNGPSSASSPSRCPTTPRT